MLRIHVQLRKEQVERLKEMAAERNASLAELIRQAIDSWLQPECAISRQERKRRALAAAGRFHSGKMDLSEAHDGYLNEAYEG